MRKFIAFVPALALMAQPQSTQPIPTQFPPVHIEPIPTQMPGPQMLSPAPRPGPGSGLTIGGLQANRAVLVYRLDPQYTPAARAAGLQGTVSLYVEVDRDGTPSKVKVMEGLGLGLDEEAVNAVKKWKYEPDRGAADQIQDALEVDLSFRLDTPAPWFVSSEYYTFSGAEIQRYGEIVRPVPIRYFVPDGAACRKAGTTTVRLTVGKDGVAHAVRGDGALGEAPVKAVESWQFKPALGKGSQVEAQGQVEFRCRPADGAEETPPTEAPRYRVGGSVSAPVLLSKVEPEYSDEARKAKLQGVSMLSVRISPEGKATDIQFIRRLGMGLDQKALECVKHWHFQPGMKGATPVTVEATIEINFRLL
jgi:TonB family protein